MGRVGLVSLGQIAILALGAWVAARLDFGTSLPFPIVLLLAGLITMVLGTLVGLPALRLSGLYLALITLMLAGAITVVLTATNFPNGGTRLPRPHGVGDRQHRRSAGRRSPRAIPAYFRYTVVVAALMFLLALWHIRSQAGPRLGRDPPERAGRARGGREHHALQAVGVRARVVHDRRRRRPARPRASASSTPSSSRRATRSSCSRSCLMGGIYSLWGAVVAGMFMKLLPGLARQPATCPPTCSRSCSASACCRCC